jgi:hypothetical protein
MSSSVEAHDGIDCTVTPAIEIPIRRQKRTFTTDVISDVWVEGQREILLKLKGGTRVISPRTVSYVDDLLNQCDTALGEDSKNEYFEEIIEGLQSSMPFLEARLEADNKFAAELDSFAALGQENVLLKYGDYCAEGCNTIRLMAVGQNKRLLQGRKWKDVVLDLDLEGKALKKWEDDGKSGAAPATPIKTLLLNISLMWEDFGEEQLVGMMRFYADLNGLTHNGLNKAIKERKWPKLATLLRRDYHNVNIYYPQLKDKGKADLLRTVVESCQKKFFEWIEDEWDEGDVSAGNYKLNDDIAAEDIKIHAAKKKAKEDAEKVAELEQLVLASSSAEKPLTEAQIAELKAAQSEYQALLADEKERAATAKKQKVEEAAQETARKEAAKTKIAEAKARLEKAKGKTSA